MGMQVVFGERRGGWREEGQLAGCWLILLTFMFHHFIVAILMNRSIEQQTRTMGYF